MVVAHERQRRLPKIAERHSFAQEFRIHRNAESFAVLLAGLALERRDDDVVCRPRQHRAANHDDVVGGFVAQYRPDLLAYTDEIREVDAPVAPARRADADERHVCVANSLGRVGRRTQAPFIDAAGE